MIAGEGGVDGVGLPHSMRDEQFAVVDGAGQFQALVELARHIYRGRRQRKKHLPELCLGEPAWDIVLDLFIQSAEAKPVSVSSAAIAADVPTSTALRYIAALVDAGVVHRGISGMDRRVTYLTLSRLGFQKVVNCLSEQARSIALDEV